MRTIAVFSSCLAVVIAGCSLAGQDAPPLTGPSELALSVALSAMPDTIDQDGASEAIVSVLARDVFARPLAGVSFAVSVRVAGQTTDFGTLAARWIATDALGRAAVRYTAPPPPPATAESDTTIDVVFTPVGTDFADAVARAVSIRLLRPTR